MSINPQDAKSSQDIKSSATLQFAADVRYVPVDAEHAGQRLDNFLLAELRGVPKSLVYRIVRTGQVRVNKGRAQASYRIGAGDLIRIPPVRLAEQPPSIPPSSALLRQLEAAILYEDAKLLVINKPAGLAVHGGSGMSHGAIEALRLIRPHGLELVHRLDRDTSGCLMLTKKRSMLRWLHQVIREETLEKRYLALLVGNWPQHKQEVEAPLLKNTLQSGERVVRVDPNGKPSRTSFQRIRQFANATLVEVRPYSGRTHQIRVHAALLGFPVAGDEKYGNREANMTFRNLGLKRLFLHAATLGVPLPEVQDRLLIKAPLDPLLEALLTRLPL